ncbi:hypothetical protein, partial [Achromobacter dolens]|uniref:hypothetical protein n=1 Tax=Achromobacter dolens TaxID=1287738 RepID=UPI001C6FC9EB
LLLLKTPQANACGVLSFGARHTLKRNPEKKPPCGLRRTGVFVFHIAPATESQGDPVIDRCGFDS